MPEGQLKDIVLEPTLYIAIPGVVVVVVVPADVNGIALADAPYHLQSAHAVVHELAPVVVE